MRLLYTTLFLVASFCALAQEPPGAQNPDTEEIPGFKIYPNPVFDNTLYVTTGQNASKEITVYDVFGDIALRDVIRSNTLNISDLSAGVYVLQVVEEHRNSTRKLVVK